MQLYGSLLCSFAKRLAAGRRRVTNCPRSVSRFMPGEEIAMPSRRRRHWNKKIAGVLTHLGENIRDIREAEM